MQANIEITSKTKSLTAYGLERSLGAECVNFESVVDEQKVCSFFLLGPFAIQDAQGNIITPKAKKTCAMLAMLILSPRATRTRVWIRDKLWSDRGEEQGAAKQSRVVPSQAMDLTAGADGEALGGSDAGTISSIATSAPQQQQQQVALINSGGMVGYGDAQAIAHAAWSMQNMQNMHNMQNMQQMQMQMAPVFPVPAMNNGQNIPILINDGTAMNNGLAPFNPGRNSGRNRMVGPYG